MRKLKAYTYDDMLDGNADVDVEYYQKSEADKVIAELNAQVDFLKTTHDSCGSCNKCADGMGKVFDENLDKLKGDYKEACDRLQTANLIKDENRKLKRALWLARASEASKEVNYWTCQDESSYAIVDFNVRHETIVSYESPHHRPYKWILIWENVENKCRAKAEEYK